MAGTPALSTTIGESAARRYAFSAANLSAADLPDSGGLLSSVVARAGDGYLLTRGGALRVEASEEAAVSTETRHQDDKGRAAVQGRPPLP